MSSLQMGHSSIRGLRRLEWAQGVDRIGRSGVSGSQALEGCRPCLCDVGRDVREDEAMKVAAMADKDVSGIAFRV